MDIKNKQRAVIKFFPLDGCASEEIMIRLRNGDGSAACCRASAFRWISELGRGSKKPRNKGRPKRTYQNETGTLIRLILHKDPNASRTTLAGAMFISPETVRTHMSRIGDSLKALRWFPTH
jgi:hypothetical protein